MTTQATVSDEYQVLLELVRAGEMATIERTPLEYRALMTYEPDLPDDAVADAQEWDGIPVLTVRAGGASDERVILYFHGGAYIGCSPRTHRAFAASVSRKTGATVALVDYRLAPEHPFPAAFDDAMRAYQWLTSSAGLAVPATSVVVAGDSAGGGLAVALLAQIAAFGSAVPVAAALISPWADLALAGASLQSEADADPIVSNWMLSQAVAAYLAGADPRDPRASAVYADLAGLPPVLIHVGEAEILRDDSVTLADRLRADGSPVDLYVGPGMIHVWHMVAEATPEGARAIDDLAAWIVARFEHGVRQMNEIYTQDSVRSVLDGPYGNGSGAAPLGLTLTRRLVEAMANATLDLAPETALVPAEVFTSDEIFRAELEMFQRVPHVVGWGGEIRAPGDFTTKRVVDTSVLIVRHADGSPRAFVNACAHRGAAVAEGCGHAARFTCPYHAWSYNADGELVGISSRSMFDPAITDGLGLISLPAAEIAGLLVVSLDPDGSVDGALDPIASELEPYGFERYSEAGSTSLTIQANWKLVMDVNFEGYHIPSLHRETIAPMYVNNSVFDVFGDDCRWALPNRSVAELRDLPESEWPPHFGGLVVHGLVPSTVLIETSGVTQIMRAYPGRHPGECAFEMSVGWFGPLESDDHRKTFESVRDAVMAVLRDEDFPAAEQCQHGAEHGLRNIVVGRNEPMVQHLHRVWDAMARV